MAAAATAVASLKANKGDTAWMLITSSLLVLMMSVPGLALFYGGLVRTKNMLSVLMQVFMIVSMCRPVVGDSTAIRSHFGNGDCRPGNPYLGGLVESLFLKGIDPTSTVGDLLATAWSSRNTPTWCSR